MNKTVALGLVSAAAIILAAYFGQGTQYEDAWLYLTGVSIVLITTSELFFKKK